MVDPFTFLNQHIPVSREIFDRLSIYHDLLVKWQTSINLVGPSTISESWNRHFLDSLQLIPHIKEGQGAIIDIGTGAGFPGMALAIAGIANIHLVESDAKKIAFLREVARLTKTTHVTIHHGRIEKMEPEKTSVILSRAVADLTSLLDYSSRFVSYETKCLFHKGKNWATEMEEAKKYFTFTHEIFPSLSNPDAVIVQLSHIDRLAHDPKRTTRND